MIFIGMNLPWAELLLIFQVITIILLVYFIKKKMR